MSATGDALAHLPAPDASARGFRRVSTATRVTTRNVHGMLEHRNLRCGVTLWEICDYAGDYRAYSINVEIGRYGRGSVDPCARGEVWRVEGTYIDGMQHADEARAVFKRIAAMLPQVGDATDPMHGAPIPDNAATFATIRAAVPPSAK